jgi:uncharacterized damage-inducible protein DinB
MAGNVRPVADERDGLLQYLAQARYVLRLTAHGLTDDQARQASTRSQLTVGGLIKHVAYTERGWIDTVLQRKRPAESPDADAYDQHFHFGPEDTLEGVFAFYDEVAEETASVIAGIEDLGQAVPVPQDEPWFPKDIEAWSVRWVLLHLIQETARHAGHADLVREHVDGGTAFPLMAAAEGWPASPWMTPWSPETQPA